MQTDFNYASEINIAFFPASVTSEEAEDDIQSNTSSSLTLKEGRPTDPASVRLLIFIPNFRTRCMAVYHS